MGDEKKDNTLEFTGNVEADIIEKLDEKPSKKKVYERFIGIGIDESGIPQIKNMAGIPDIATLSFYIQLTAERLRYDVIKEICEQQNVKTVNMLKDMIDSAIEKKREMYNKRKNKGGK